jgi:hypothetical protein
MAILFQEGMDLYGTDEAKWLQYGWTRESAQVEVQASSGRGGGGALSLQYDQNYARIGIPKASVTTVFAHVACYYDNGGSISASNWGIMTYVNNTNDKHGWLKVNASKQLEFRDSAGTLQGTSTQTVSPDVWHDIQTKIFVHDSTGTFECWLDGVQVLNLSGLDTLNNTGNPYLEAVYYGTITSAGSGNPDLRDDFAIWDESGSDWTTWTTGKVVEIETLRANADTAQEDFTPLGAGDQYAELDETPDHDGDTSYNESASSGDKDRVGLTTITGTPIVIYNVRVRAVAKKTAAGAALVKVGVYSGATEGVSAGLGLSTDYDFVEHDLPVNPDDSAAWEKADIDALQAQYEHA